MFSLVKQLKENGQDFEFYPTTREMLNIVYDNIPKREERYDILDIGCGQAGLKSVIDYRNALIKENDPYAYRSVVNYNYFGIEKSEILIRTLPEDVYILGTDFNELTLIDKKADIVFCNPPYSEYENWTARIIKEGNFQLAYMVIPQRWKESKIIQEYLKLTKTDYEVLKTMDFLNAERQARAVVDIVKFKSAWHWEKDSAFDIWFEETFNIKAKERTITMYMSDRLNNLKEEVNTELEVCENKVEYLVNRYNREFDKMQTTFKKICEIDEDILEDVGVNYHKVKESLRKKIEDIKILYWRLVFDYLDEITSRLTQKSRDDLFTKFKRLNQVDFTVSNVKSVVIWVMKHASQYFEEQLIDFYRKLSDVENVRPYKSNQKLFDKEEWRYLNYNDRKYFTLDYRMVCSYLFTLDRYQQNHNKALINDFCAIARNLGFDVAEAEVVVEHGKKHYVYMKDNTVLFEFKVYQNRNTHIKLNIELAKAMNVEVSRLLGWIKDKSDIAKEFPEEMAKGAEKYFNSNFSLSIENPKIKMLGMR